MNSTPNPTSPQSTREAVLRGKNAPHVNLGHVLTEATVPPEVASLPRWLAWCWKLGRDDGRWEKLPQVISPAAGGPALKPGFSKNREADLKALLPLKRLLELVGGASVPLGMMLVPGQIDDSTWLVALDFDDLNTADQKDWPPTVREAFETGQGWWSRSVSGYGLRVVGTVNLKVMEVAPRDGSFTAPFKGELKATNPVTITNANLHLGDLDITDLWLAMQDLLPAPRVAKPAPSDWSAGPEDSDPEFMARVITAAEGYLNWMEPAVQGNNGSAAFFRACCKIAGGYGLRGDEGFALACQWNQEKCLPPFSEAEVIHKWSDALRETEGEFPNKRQPILDSWLEQHPKKKDLPKKAPRQAQGTAEMRQAPVLRERVPMSLDTNNDAEVRARIVEIVATDPTGMPLIFERADGEDTRAVHVALKEQHGLRFPVIVSATNAHIREAVTRCISFTQRTQHGVREVSAKDRHLDMIRENPVGLPRLTRVLHGPSYDPRTDTVMNTAGYDRDTGHLLAQTVELSVPERVSRPMAQAAVRELLHAFRHMEFRDGKCGPEVYKARYLVELMTILMRHRLKSIPAFMHVANTPSSGKSYLARAASLICHGRDLRLRVMPVGNGAEIELTKSLITIAMGGQPIACFDNVDRGTELKSSALEGLITSGGGIEGRRMGESRNGGGDYAFTLILTGNAIRPHQDFRQRVIEIHLTGDPNGRKRHLSEFGDQGDLVTWLHEPRNRGRLLSALITIARGYQQAGRPTQPGEALTGYPGFVEEAVDPIRWALGIDPLKGQAEEFKENDLETVHLGRLFEAILQAPGLAKGSPFTTAELFAAAEPESELREAMSEAARYFKLATLDAPRFGQQVLANYTEYPVLLNGATYQLKDRGRNRKGIRLFTLEATRTDQVPGRRGWPGLTPRSEYFSPEFPLSREKAPAGPGAPALSDGHVVAEIGQTSQTANRPADTPLGQSDALDMTADIPASTVDTGRAPAPIDREAIKRHAQEVLGTLRQKAPVFRGSPMDDPADLAGTKLDALRAAIREADGDKEGAKQAFLAAGFTRADFDWYQPKVSRSDMVAGRKVLVLS